MYRKLRIPADATVLAGDVVATGVTVANGLQVLVDHLVRIGSSLRSLVFFTIGGDRLDEVLQRLEPTLSEAFPGWIGSHAVYLEGIHGLATEEACARLGRPGTDLMRGHGLLSPEMEMSQYDRPGPALERCAIYDAGSRAFDVPSYVDDVAGYWRGMGELAEEGLTLREALAERWPDLTETSREGFIDRRRRRWGAAGNEWGARVWERLDRLRTALEGEGGGAGALATLCEERLRVVQAALE